MGFKNKYWIAYVLLIFFSTHFSLRSNAQKKQIDFGQFAGKWQQENSDITEQWEITMDDASGKAFRVNNGDTLVMELLRISKHASDYFYEAMVPAQNQGKTIRFKLVEHTTNTYLFENAKHDFPQKIKYNFKSSVRLKVTISNAEKKKVLNYIRERD